MFTFYFGRGVRISNVGRSEKEGLHVWQGLATCRERAGWVSIRYAGYDGRDAGRNYVSNVFWDAQKLPAEFRYLKLTVA